MIQSPRMGFKLDVGAFAMLPPVGWMHSRHIELTLIVDDVKTDPAHVIHVIQGYLAYSVLYVLIDLLL